MPSFIITPLTAWGEGVRFAVFGGGSSPLLLGDLSIGNIGENCNEPSEKFQLGNLNGSVEKSSPLPRDENLGL